MMRVYDCRANARRVVVKPNSCRCSFFSTALSLPFDYFKRLCVEGKLRQALHSLHLIPWRLAGTSFSLIYNNLLQGCIKHKDFATAQEVYCLIVKHGYDADPFLGTSLIRLHAIFGSLAKALSVFNTVQRPDAFAWGALISAHSKHGELQQAINLYHEMTRANFKPDSHVFVAVIKACADSCSEDSLINGKLAHFHITERDLEQAQFVSNALINMYGRCGSLEDAHTTFNQSSKKDAVAWSAIISGYSHHECGAQAFQLFLKMQKEGIMPDEISCVCAIKACCGIAALKEGRLLHTQVIESGFHLNAVICSTLIDMYAKCGNLEDAKSVFSALRSPDVVTWSAMIGGYTFNNEYKLALRQFSDMKVQGLKPNEAILLCVLSSYSQLGLIDECASFFKSMQKEFGINPTKEHVNCLVSLLGKAGRLKEAEDILHHMSFKSNLVGLTSLLNCCKIHGELEIGQHCFNDLIESDYHDASAYALMSDIYAGKGRWADASNIDKMRESAQAWKKPGKAFIHVNDSVHEFVVLGSETPFTILCNISRKIKAMHVQCIGRGHVPEHGLSFELYNGSYV